MTRLRWRGAPPETNALTPFDDGQRQGRRGDRRYAKVAGHRMLVSPAADVNLHVWPQEAPEPIRHRLFRDWLRSHSRASLVSSPGSPGEIWSGRPPLQT